MRRAFCAVALLALVSLLVRAGRVGLAGDYVDPIGKITAQDEALYSHSAIHMATVGGWLTPMFMGRYALYKPPMLLWLAGLSARIAGVTALGGGECRGAEECEGSHASSSHRMLQTKLVG